MLCASFSKCGMESSFQDFSGGPVVKTLPSNAGGTASIPGRGTKIPHAAQCGQKKKKKKESSFQGGCANQSQKLPADGRGLSNPLAHVCHPKAPG